ncbi:MAG TPA: endo alpha-1,4 polygalactosaminidase, partial [Candidatus Wallbacteria bacterium]|nr:endo alpha-1,4 polygalactosaminidase [Candidatus Wallbacteria bacterium]
KEYKIFLDKKIMAAENPDWKGSFYVDVGSAEWRAYLLETAIPEIVKKGFNGLFLDTLDSPLRLMAQDPKKYPKMNIYLCELIKDIRSKFPRLEIIANNFEEHADEIGPYVNGFNVEELVSAYNFKNKTYEKIKKSESIQRIKRLKKVSEKYDVQIFVVDYVSPGNKKTAVYVYNKIKELGFVPYISTVDLNKISSHMIYLNESYSQEL